MASENGANPASPEGDDDALRQFGFETRTIHAGHRPDPYTGASVAPLYQSSAFAFEDTESAAAYFNLQEYGNIYSRIMNPTVAAFEERVANLEGGVGAVAFASGMAAQVGAFFTMLAPGDHIVASRSIYGGSITQLKITFAKLSLDVTLVDPDDLDAWRAALRPETKALFAETIGNPGGNILDIAAVAEIAHAHNAPLVIDNTFASPYLCRPIEWGADIVLHSATKYIDGHGTSIGGIVIDAGKFNWSNGRYATIAAPSAEYHGLEFHETFGLYGYLMKLRAETLRDLGAALSPFNAFLYLLGLETLPLRMERHVSNAQGVARFLAGHPMVERVRYAGLPDSPYHERAKRYLPKGPSAVFAVDLKGGRAAGQRFIEALTLWTHLANVGDTKSLVIHPASTTHRQLSDEELPATGVTPGTVRLSVGLESLDDLLWDLEKGLRAVKAGLDTSQAQASESSEEAEARAWSVDSLNGKQAQAPGTFAIAEYQNPQVIRRTLLGSRTVAIVGLSPNPLRASYFVGYYLQRHGYRIVPVNPKEQEILGETCYPSLSAIPFPVDVVDVFRRPDAVPAIAEEAVKIGAKILWLQFEVISPEGAATARAGGLDVVMDRCMKVEHARYLGRMRWYGLNTGVISSRRQ